MLYRDFAAEPQEKREGPAYGYGVDVTWVIVAETELPAVTGPTPIQRANGGDALRPHVDMSWAGVRLPVQEPDQLVKVVELVIEASEPPGPRP